MIQSSDLRIGNLLQCAGNDNYFAVTAEDLVLIDSGSSEAKPVPITEYWLVISGFKKDEVLEFYRNETSGSTIIIDKNFICLLGYSHVKIKYVHQLQNLFFALTGKELKMKSITDIAKECGVPFRTVYEAVTDEQILTENGNAKINLTETQADYVQQVLHNKGYFQFLTLESKMNNL